MTHQSPFGPSWDFGILDVLKHIRVPVLDEHKRVVWVESGPNWDSVTPVRLLYTVVGPHFCVSTVFLGADRGWGTRPIFFESLVFDTRGSEGVAAMRRASTWQEAKRTHRSLVREARRAVNTTRGLRWRRRLQLFYRDE